MIPRLIPGVHGGDVRRRVPKASQNRKVPLWTVEPEGQLFQGVIRVPLRLVQVPEHTNEALEFNKLIVDNLERWAEWRRRKGWMLAERPRVQGPFDPPEGDRIGKFQERAEKQIGRSREATAVTEFDYADEFKWYTCEARFTREEPVYARLEDMLELRHLALTYGVDPDRDPLPYTVLPEGKDVIDVQGGLNPLVVAEERRQALGLKRADYLMGKLWEPL